MEAEKTVHVEAVRKAALAAVEAVGIVGGYALSAREQIGALAIALGTFAYTAYGEHKGRSVATAALRRAIESAAVAPPKGNA